VKNPEALSTSKPLFDPIVITVGKPAETRSPKTDDKSNADAETVSAEKTLKKPGEKVPQNTQDTDPTGETRPRVIQEKVGQPCTIIASQDSLSLLSGGGTLGLLVGFEDEDGDPKTITAASSSPDDVEVRLEPGIGQRTKRVFFAVKSISAKTGEFTLIFSAACGTKEIPVRIR
jgi:hypothetical protein